MAARTENGYNLIDFDQWSVAVIEGAGMARVDNMYAAWLRATREAHMAEIEKHTSECGICGGIVAMFSAQNSLASCVRHTGVEEYRRHGIVYSCCGAMSTRRIHQVAGPYGAVYSPCVASRHLRRDMLSAAIKGFKDMPEASSLYVCAGNFPTMCVVAMQRKHEADPDNNPLQFDPADVRIAEETENESNYPTTETPGYIAVSRYDIRGVPNR